MQISYYDTANGISTQVLQSDTKRAIHASVLDPVWSDQAK